MLATTLLAWRKTLKSPFPAKQNALVSFLICGEASSLNICCHPSFPSFGNSLSRRVLGSKSGDLNWRARRPPLYSPAIARVAYAYEIPKTSLRRQLRWSRMLHPDFSQMAEIAYISWLQSVKPIFARIPLARESNMLDPLVSMSLKVLSWVTSNLIAWLFSKIVAAVIYPI